MTKSVTAPVSGSTRRCCRSAAPLRTTPRRGRRHFPELLEARHEQLGGDVAVARLAEALRLPAGIFISRVILRADASWAPLRGHPGFERMLAGG